MHIFKTLIKNKFLLIRLIGLFLLLNFTQGVFAQGQQAMNQNETLLITAAALVFFVALIVLIIAFYAYTVIRLIISSNEKKAAEEAGEVAETEQPLASWWQDIKGKMTDAVPVKEEETVMMNHDYDGIRELDNHLPPWWKYLFYVTILFSVIYVAGYHVFGWMPTQEEEYKQQMAMAEARMQQQGTAADTASGDVNIAFTDDDARLNNGQEIYETNCATCHQKDGGGQIGPNLTDQYWIHGGSFEDIYNTIKNGVPQKGMIPWENQLSTKEMVNVASYVETLRGTEPSNPKEPEGEKYVPENEGGNQASS